MDAIDALITARVSKPAGVSAGDVPVWNGTTWVVPSGTRTGSKFLRDDGSWASAGGTGSPATTLPASPTDGQQAVLVDSTTAPTYAWLLQYSTTASKWIFLGGSPSYTTVDTSQNGAGANNTFVDFPTVGPSFTVPRAGVYLVRFGALAGGNGSATSSYIGVKVGATNPTLGTDRSAIKVSNSTAGGLAQEYETGSIAASTVLKLVMADGDSTRAIAFADRWMSVIPVTVT